MWVVHEDHIPGHMTVADFLRFETDFEAAIDAVRNPELERLVAVRDVPGVEVPANLDHAFAAAFDRFDHLVWESVVSEARELPQPDPALLIQFQNIAGIDAGEAVMLARLIEDPNTLFLTGDKRALRAVAAMDDKVRASIAERVVPVECIIKCVLDAFGIDELRARVCTWKDVDKAVAIVMGSRCDQAEASVREGLASYLGELYALCRPSLIRAC